MKNGIYSTGLIDTKHILHLLVLKPRARAFLKSSIDSHKVISVIIWELLKRQYKIPKHTIHTSLGISAVNILLPYNLDILIVIQKT